MTYNFKLCWPKTISNFFSRFIRYNIQHIIICYSYYLDKKKKKRIRNLKMIFMLHPKLCNTFRHVLRASKSLFSNHAADTDINVTIKIHLLPFIYFPISYVYIMKIQIFLRFVSRYIPGGENLSKHTRLYF